MKSRTVLAIFRNDNIKSFHIWTTTQEDLKNVTVTNAYSKAKSSINGKLSSESAATTSFFRVLLNTDRKYWYVRYIDLGVVNSKDDGEDFYNLYHDELVDMNYKCLTRNKKYRHASGKYAGKKHQYMIIEKMKKPQIVRHATNMLEDISYSNDMINDAADKIYFAAVTQKHINNISELWKHTYENYSEAA